MVITLGVFSVVPALGRSGIGIIIPTVFGVHFSDRAPRTLIEMPVTAMTVNLRRQWYVLDVGMWGLVGCTRSSVAAGGASRVSLHPGQRNNYIMHTYVPVSLFGTHLDDVICTL